MKRFVGILGSLGLLIIPVTPLYADDLPPWEGNMELSYLQTSGNSNSQTLATAGKLVRTFTNSSLTAEAKAIYGEKEGVASDRSWFTLMKYDQNITERASVFVLETVERNVLKGIEFRYSHQGGIGYYFIKAVADTLKVEAGAGYVHEDRIDPFKDHGFPTARLFGDYLHAFDEKNRFEQTVEYLPNLRETKDYLLNEETALITNLMGNLALKVSFTVAFDNLPPPDFQKSDRVFKTAFLYTF